MMNTTRRQMLVNTAILAPLAGLVACNTPSTAATVSAQALADAQGLVPVVQAVVAAINQYAPGMISPTVQTQITAAEQAAIAGLQSLSTSTSAMTGAATLQNVDAAINAILSAIGAALPAASILAPVLTQFVPMYDAAVAIVPAIEAWINSVIAPSAAKAGAAHIAPIHSVLPAPVARTLLGIKTVQ